VYATIETANDHWMMLDVYGTGDSLGGTAYYNWNDEPYWIHYGWEVQYADGTGKRKLWMFIISGSMYK
jgi:hypothetical protein